MHLRRLNKLEVFPVLSCHNFNDDKKDSLAHKEFLRKARFSQKPRDFAHCNDSVTKFGQGVTLVFLARSVYSSFDKGCLSSS